jgi:glucose/arabinose dehydrogenase
VRRAPLGFAIALVLVVAACTDDDEATPTTTIPISPATTTTTAPGTLPPETTTTTTEPPAPPPPLSQVSLDLIEVASGFDQPVFATGRPGDDRLYVADQVGRVHGMALDGSDPAVVLDISGRTVFGGEQGLLGLAFHPGDPTRMFVHYSRTGDGATVVEEYRLPEGAVEADPAPVRTLLTVPQPAGNHNGGMIDFGPDAMLYIALGDGGGANDQFGHGQDPSTRLGAILRIDVDGGDPYAVPGDNPFADGAGGAPEVWMYGLRNPWRFSFDGDDLWIADVGQGDWEEINLVGVGDGGANLGWPVLEGTSCFAGPPGLCADNDFVDPVFEYTISGVPRCAIMGGYVYRGSASPVLHGAYLFADHCTGEIMALRVEGGEVTEDRVFDSVGERVTSFGVDMGGEVYVVTMSAVYRVTAQAG